MRAYSILLATAGLTLVSATPAAAQWLPGAELSGQAVQVQADGIVNTIHFDPGGAARIDTPAGTVVPASWTSSANGLCLSTAGAQECWAYNAPLSAGQAMQMTSSCQGVSTWTPLATNVAPPTPPPVSSAAGERG